MFKLLITPTLLYYQINRAAFSKQSRFLLSALVKVFMRIRVSVLELTCKQSKVLALN